MTKSSGVLNWYGKCHLARQYRLIGGSFVKRMLRLLRLCLIAGSVRGSVEGSRGRHEMFLAFLELRSRGEKLTKHVPWSPSLQCIWDARYCLPTPTLVYFKSEIAKGYLRALLRMPGAKTEVMCLLHPYNSRCLLQSPPHGALSPLSCSAKGPPAHLGTAH